MYTLKSRYNYGIVMLGVVVFFILFNGLHYYIATGMGVADDVKILFDLVPLKWLYPFATVGMVIYFSAFRFTKSIEVNSQFITIEYYRFFKTHQLELNTIDVYLYVDRPTQGLAYLPQQGLYVINKVTQVYQASTLHGYKRQEFDALVAHHESLKPNIDF